MGIRLTGDARKARAEEQHEHVGVGEHVNVGEGVEGDRGARKLPRCMLGHAILYQLLGFKLATPNALRGAPAAHRWGAHVHVREPRA